MKPAHAWCLYDVGHSAFATTMMAAVLPVWFATQIATNLDPDPERARVLATAGTAEKCAACERLGAERAIHYRDEDFVDVVKDVTEGRGVDVIYDPVGDKLADPAFRTIAWEGRYLVIGFAGVVMMPAAVMLIFGLLWLMDHLTVAEVGDAQDRGPQRLGGEGRELARGRRDPCRPLSRQSPMRITDQVTTASSRRSRSTTAAHGALPGRSAKAGPNYSANALERDLSSR